MIEIERHIEILLLSNDCVIVPGLGGFMAHHIDARYDEGDGMFVPPLRTLGFNPQLTMNDSLLVQSYIETYDISYPEALRRIEAEVAELRQHLETEGSFELNDIGVLSLNEEGKLVFEPCEAGILTPDLYGLGTFEMKPLVKALPVTETTGEKPEQEKPIDRAIIIKMSWLRNVAVVAAAVLAFFMIGTPVKNSDLSKGIQQSAIIPLPSSSVVSEEEDTSIALPDTLLTDSPQQADTAEGSESDLSDTAAAPSFCIVLASQVTQRNAESFVSMLEEKGFHEASIMMTKFRRVVYGAYSSEEEAMSSLRQLRSQSSFFKEAWVMKIED